MRTTLRFIFCLPAVFTALDEPTNVFSINLFAWVFSADPIQCVSNAHPPARGLDDVTDIDVLTPPAPPLPDLVGEILLEVTAPVTSDDKLFSRSPASIPLLC
jgi:hypothetical protein